MITIDIESIDTSERMQDEIIHLLDASSVKPEPVIKGLQEFYNIVPGNDRDATIKQLQEENARLAAPAQESNRLMSENARLEEENQRLKEALSLQDDYVKLLGEEIDTMIPLAHTHGWRSTRHEAGKELRAKINNARKLIEP